MKERLLIVDDEHDTFQKMPAMTGLDLLEALEKEADYADRVVKILPSGYADVPEIVKAVAPYGIHRHLVKPIDSRRLRDTIRELKQRSASGDWVLTKGTDECGSSSPIPNDGIPVG